MMMINRNDDFLDDIFAEARAVTPDPHEDLVARVLADAVLPPRSQQTEPRETLWTRFLDSIGGWPAASGLAAATLVGVWIGVAPPSSVEELTASFIGEQVSVALFSSGFDYDDGIFADG